MNILICHSAHVSSGYNKELTYPARKHRIMLGNTPEYFESVLSLSRPSMSFPYLQRETNLL